MALRHLKQSMNKQSNMNSCRLEKKQNDSTMNQNVSTLYTDSTVFTYYHRMLTVNEKIKSLFSN